jgi:diacylglycerol kinase (ATP)
LKRHIAFIINPISGGVNKIGFNQLIDKYLDLTKYSYEMVYTNSTQHNKSLAESYANKEEVDIVVAVGGDGTINNTAAYIAGTDKVFSIIPFGSGNGLARHLGLYGSIQRSFQIINEGKVKAIDTGSVNNHFFLNVAGAGFDAHISDLFDKTEKRGFIEYLRISLKEFANYKALPYRLEVDGNVREMDAFIVCVANGSQYGNNAYIAPQANVTDGIFEITIIKPFTFWGALALGYKMFTKLIHQSKSVEILSGKQINLLRKNDGVVNIDGEPFLMEKSLTFKIHPNHLNVIVP